MEKIELRSLPMHDSKDAFRCGRKLHLRNRTPEHIASIGRIAAIEIGNLPTKFGVAAIGADEEVTFLRVAVSKARHDYGAFLPKAGALGVHLHWDATEGAVEHRVEVGSTDRDGYCSLRPLDLMQRPDR